MPGLRKSSGRRSLPRSTRIKAPRRPWDRRPAASVSIATAPDISWSTPWLPSSTSRRPVPSSSIRRRSSPCQRIARARLHPSTTASSRRVVRGSLAKRCTTQTRATRNSQPRSSQRVRGFAHPGQQQHPESRRRTADPAAGADRGASARSQSPTALELMVPAVNRSGRTSWSSSSSGRSRRCTSSASPPCTSTAAGLGMRL